MKFLFVMGISLILAGFPILVGAESLPADSSLLLADFGRGDYAVEGHFRVPASRPIVWQVLTDYDHMPRFISSMQICQVQSRKDDHLLLKQEAEGHLWVFSKRIEVLLSVLETPMTEITFEDIGNKDFSSYQGSWEIRESIPGMLEVIYRLNAKRKFPAPGFLAKAAFEKNVGSLLNEVRAEMLRRQERKPV